MQITTFCFDLFSLQLVYSAGLSNEALITAAQSMEEIFYAKGDDIIVQDDIGDSFFVLEEGSVSVTVRACEMFLFRTIHPS